MGNPLLTVQAPCVAELQVEGRWIRCQRPQNHGEQHQGGNGDVAVSWLRAWEMR